MILLDACEDGDVLTGIKNFLVIVNIVKVLVPLIIVAMGIKVFVGVVTNGTGEKFKEAFISFAKKLVIGLVIFLFPTFVNGLLSVILPEGNNYQTCIKNATPAGIKAAYYNKAKKMIKKAKDDLEGGELRDAYAYAKQKVTSQSQFRELEKEIKKIQKYIDVYEHISAMSDKKQYDELKKEVDSVDDAEVRAKLQDKLDKKRDSLQDKHEIPLPSDGQGGSGGQGGSSGSGGVADVNLDGEEVRKEETDTLKVYIKKVNNYYVTQVWVADPYNQLNKYDSPQYGQALYTPGALLQKAMNQYSLSDKLIVGFNASGFYLKNTYDAASVNYYPPYDRTSVGTLVITNGKVVRNAYDKAYKTWYIAGVDKSGTFNIYTDAKTNDLNAKKVWADSVISNIRNTYTFASPLVVNGAASTDTTSMPSPSGAPNRQAMCQIDKNNFVLITGPGLTRQNLIDIMLKVGCKTGTNFDGGGSIALLFKSKNSTKIDTIIGNGRALTEVGYFSEQ